MTQAGQKEKATQGRVVKLLESKLGYEYLGNWIDREGNSNIEEDLLRSFLDSCGYDGDLITKALHRLDKAAGATNKTIEPLVASAPGVQNRVSAVEYAKAVILDLKGADFSHNLPQMADFSDVYGVERDGKELKPWQS